MKRRFLVLYDYGQGGVWAFIKAHSSQDIERLFPALEVVNAPPSWMSAEEIRQLEERMTFDIDQPRGWLATFIEDRKRRGPGIAAG